MRRRNLAAGIAVVGIAVAMGAGTTLAAGTHHPRKEPVEWGKRWVYKPTTTALSCTVWMTVVPPYGSDTVSPPEDNGVMYGPTDCPRGDYSETATFGPGVISAPFHTVQSGDTVSQYTEYFPGGSVNGEMVLTPQGGTFGKFGSETWTGTMTVTAGHGVYRHARTSNAGTMNCSSPDSVHLNCTEQTNLSWLVRVQKRVRLG